jgi:hypothetical protein
MVLTALHECERRLRAGIHDLHRELFIDPALMRLPESLDHIEGTLGLDCSSKIGWSLPDMLPKGPNLSHAVEVKRKLLLTTLPKIAEPAPI